MVPYLKSYSEKSELERVEDIVDRMDPMNTTMPENPFVPSSFDKPNFIDQFIHQESTFQFDLCVRSIQLEFECSCEDSKEITSFVDIPDGPPDRRPDEIDRIGGELQRRFFKEGEFSFILFGDDYLNPKVGWRATVRLDNENTKIYLYEDQSPDIENPEDFLHHSDLTDSQKRWVLRYV